MTTEALQARDRAPNVRGTTYALRAVDGAPLPVRFPPLDNPPTITNAQLDSGRITFGADGVAQGAWYAAGDPKAGTAQIFRFGYAQDGERVLIQGRESAAPDTAVVSGTTLSVRAQFTRRPSGEPYIVMMDYAR